MYPPTEAKPPPGFLINHPAIKSAPHSIGSTSLVIPHNSYPQILKY